VCIFRFVLTTEWSPLRGLGHTQDPGFPSMTSRNPRVANDGLKHRIVTRNSVPLMLAVQPLQTVPTVRLYRLVLLAVKWDRLSGSKVNRNRSHHATVFLVFRSCYQWYIGWIVFDCLVNWCSMCFCDTFYHMMLCSAQCCYVNVVCLSVRPSVCNVKILWSCGNKSAV